MPRTIAELRAELAAKEKQVSKLRAQRKKIMKQLAALDGEIAALGGGPFKRKRKVATKATRTAATRKGPARTQPSLADVLAQVLAGKGNVKVAEAAKSARAAGYKSTSSQFGNIVSQALAADKRFRKVSRGVYTLKGSGKAAKKAVRRAAKNVRKKVAKKATKSVVRKKGAKKARGRAAKKPLSTCLLEALQRAGKPSRALELASAVRKAGYSTQDKNFKQTVASALGTDDRFERVSRGVYKLA